MNIDNALQEFTEKYDRDAIKSIDDISKEIGLVQNKYTIDAFNMNEAFDSFTKYLKGYACFIEQAAKSNDKAAKTMEHTKKPEVDDSFKRYIDTECVKEQKLTYDQLPEFVEAFLIGVQQLSSDVTEIQESLDNIDADQETIGGINEYANEFLESVWNQMNPVMDKILWASGYNSNKKLMNPSKKKETVFA